MAVISPCKGKMELDGTELVKARDGLFLSQAAFAARCGWVRQEQSRLERPGKRDITVEKANIILKALGKEIRKCVER